MDSANVNFINELLERRMHHVLLLIFNKLDFASLRRVLWVCRDWREFVQHNKKQLHFEEKEIWFIESSLPEVNSKPFMLTFNRAFHSFSNCWSELLCSMSMEDLLNYKLQEEFAGVNDFEATEDEYAICTTKDFQAMLMGWKMGGFPLPWKVKLSTSLLRTVPEFVRDKAWVKGVWDGDGFFFETGEKHFVDGLNKSMYRAFNGSNDGTGLEQMSPHDAGPFCFFEDEYWKDFGEQQSHEVRILKRNGEKLLFICDLTRTCLVNLSDNATLWSEDLNNFAKMPEFESADLDYSYFAFLNVIERFFFGRKFVGHVRQATRPVNDDEKQNSDYVVSIFSTNRDEGVQTLVVPSGQDQILREALCGDGKLILILQHPEDTTLVCRQYNVEETSSGKLKLNERCREIELRPGNFTDWRRMLQFSYRFWTMHGENHLVSFVTKADEGLIEFWDLSAASEEDNSMLCSQPVELYCALVILMLILSSLY